MPADTLKYLATNRENIMKLENFVQENAHLKREDLVRMIYIDPMTQIWNRRAFDEQDHHGPLAIIDLDSLKWMNDTFGHRLGDSAIAQLAGILERQFPGNTYRLGGDEFVVLANSREAILGGLLLAQMAATSVIMANDHYHCKNAASFSFGIGGTLEDADKLLREDKNARETTGARASRGETPPGVTPRLQIVKG